MKKQILLWIATLSISGALYAAGSIKNHHDVNQGIDCELFLNPFVDSELKDASGQLVLDVGCGLAPLSIKAAKKGAKVYAFDTERTVLEKAHLAIMQAGLESQVALCQGAMDQLPYSSNSFDKAFCINSLSNSSATAQIAELARVMKEEGRLMIVAPASYGLVFSDGRQSEAEVQRHIEQALSKIGSSEDPAVITQGLSELKEVMRATFVRSEGKLTLVTNEKTLRIGQPIWCKIPEGVIASAFHTEEEYLAAIQQAGLTCEEIKRPCFFGGVKYRLWQAVDSENNTLGEAYLMNHPFTIFYAVKKA